MDSFTRPMTYEPGGNKDAAGNDVNGADKRWEIEGRQSGVDNCMSNCTVII